MMECNLTNTMVQTSKEKDTNMTKLCTDWNQWIALKVSGISYNDYRFKSHMPTIDLESKWTLLQSLKTNCSLSLMPHVCILFMLLTLCFVFSLWVHIQLFRLLFRSQRSIEQVFHNARANSYTGPLRHENKYAISNDIHNGLLIVFR